MVVLFLLVLGAVIGSFLNVLILRIPESETILGRSRCDSCRKEIHWYDNIPILSYIFLRGKCRFCKKKIPAIHTIIEIVTPLLFVGLWCVFEICKTTELYTLVCVWQKMIGLYFFAFLIVVISILIVIFVIDLIHMYIPDTLTYTLYGLTLVLLVFTHHYDLWSHLFAGLVSGIFFLLLHLVTKGKGMGLGDVKLALFMGTFLGRNSVTWIFLSFVIGAVVGIILIFFGKKKFKEKIAFGPFLIVSFIISLFLSDLFILKLVGL